MWIFKRDAFGHYYFLKWLIFIAVGVFSYFRFKVVNKIQIEGTEHIKSLPKGNVLFVSNHQTYFADVMALNHVISSVKWGFKDSISVPVYLLSPNLNIFYVAAKETMKSGILPKIFAYAGSVSIKRTWREAGKDVNRPLDLSDISNIGKALENGWVITFPQGTTTPYVPGRRGTTLIVKKFQPIIIPVVIDGFRRAFDKKGLKVKKRGVTLKIRFKAPLELDYTQNSDLMMDKLMYSIEQSEEFQ
jgi:1-acyl-sn-glycerol-3-phosphate acyltransferase